MSSRSVQPAWLTPKEAATHIRVSERTLEGWRRQRRGPRWVKAGHLVRYAREDVDAWLNRLDVIAATTHSS